MADTHGRIKRFQSLFTHQTQRRQRQRTVVYIRQVTGMLAKPAERKVNGALKKPSTERTMRRE